GRLATLCCAVANRQLRLRQLPAAFRPCLAGGQSAFAASVEPAEDAAGEGVAELLALLGNKDKSSKSLLVGVSCGLSAPFVLGQVGLCLGRPDLGAYPALIGFNQVGDVRADRVDGLPWPGGCRAVAKRLAEADNVDRGLLINPSIGAEAIAGSSRMKGGTATLILLFQAVGRMLAKLEPSADHSVARGWLSISEHLNLLDRLLESVNEGGAVLNDLIAHFGD
uniref:5'-nucleotidase n=1 Tax=Macrostomum lignano TaxID=282301 RepID=A0A1I8ICF9_9PLAT